MLVCFDIDGTLADCRHRLHYVRTKPKNWAAFDAGIPHDTLIQTTAEIFRQMTDAGHAVVLATGRNEASRVATETWLANNRLRGYLKIYMRADGDYRADDIVKGEMLEQIIADYGQKPDMVFDDRPRVVAMWRAAGIWVFDCNQSGVDF
jgi:phosphoglycolate phosphatase-like HAD superfamily hydrolase